MTINISAKTIKNVASIACVTYSCLASYVGGAAIASYAKEHIGKTEHEYREARAKLSANHARVYIEKEMHKAEEMRKEHNSPLFIKYLSSYYSPMSGNRICEEWYDGNDVSNRYIKENALYKINHLRANGYVGCIIMCSPFGCTIINMNDDYNKVGICIDSILNKDEEDQEVNKLLNNLCKIANNSDLALKIFGDRKEILRDLLGTINAAQETVK